MVALFNDAWLRLNGYGGKSETELDEMKANAPKAYGVSFVCNAVMAAAMTVLAEYMVLDTVAQALKLAVLVFGGFVGQVGLINNFLFRPAHRRLAPRWCLPVHLPRADGCHRRSLAVMV